MYFDHGCTYDVYWYGRTTGTGTDVRQVSNRNFINYGLRTSLAEEVEGQMSIVTQFTRRFGPIFKIYCDTYHIMSLPPLIHYYGCWEGCIATICI